jgi:hypothetical protein
MPNIFAGNPGRAAPCRGPPFNSTQSKKLCQGLFRFFFQFSEKLFQVRPAATLMFLTLQHCKKNVKRAKRFFFADAKLFPPDT